MTEPTTEAGRRLLEPRGGTPNAASYHWESCGIWGLRPCDCGLRSMVLLIEAEARADFAAGIEARVMDIEPDGYAMDENETLTLVSRTALLAAIREEAAK
jgi:hypothetical protein